MKRQSFTQPPMVLTMNSSWAAMNVAVSQAIPSAVGTETDSEAGWSPAELEGIIADYEAIVVRSATQVTRRLLDRAERLQVIARAGAGLDTIDVEAAETGGLVASLTGMAGAGDFDGVLEGNTHALRLQGSGRLGVGNISVYAATDARYSGTMLWRRGSRPAAEFEVAARGARFAGDLQALVQLGDQDVPAAHAHDHEDDQGAFADPVALRPQCGEAIGVVDGLLAHGAGRRGGQLHRIGREGRRLVRQGLDTLTALRKLMMRPDSPTCFKNPLSGQRVTAWSAATVMTAKVCIGWPSVSSNSSHNAGKEKIPWLFMTNRKGMLVFFPTFFHP